MALMPLATADVLIAQQTIEGGSGATFMVQWVSNATVSPPLVEAVMAGIERETSVSFVRSGVVIE
jgi:hypothetical protein